jgi:hypothetical protein
LCVVPNSGDVAVAACLGCDECGFGDEEGSGNGGALGVAWKGQSMLHLWRGAGAYYSATKGSGTWSSLARNRVSGAIAIRFCSCRLPSLRGLKRFDDIVVVFAAYGTIGEVIES